MAVEPWADSLAVAGRSVRVRRRPATQSAGATVLFWNRAFVRAAEEPLRL